MTQRLFKLEGFLLDDPSAGIITINGTEVYNGAFGPGGYPGILCEFAYPVDDTGVQSVDLSVIITCTAGHPGIGMFLYNYHWVSNPALTPDELAYSQSKNLTDTAPPEILASVESKGGWFLHSQDQTLFGYGATPALCQNNRSNGSLNGVDLGENFGKDAIVMSPEHVLAYTTTIFSSAL